MLEILREKFNFEFGRNFKVWLMMLTENFLVNLEEKISFIVDFVGQMVLNFWDENLFLVAYVDIIELVNFLVFG